MKYFQWWQPVWWQWEILHVSTFILGFILAHWMWLKGNAGLQFLHQQNGDNISTYASHFKWKALYSCKIALSCQYITEFFTFCLEHFIKIPPHMEQNEYYRLPKMWFLGSWQCHLHLCTFVFQIQSYLAMKFTIIWQFLRKKLTILLQVLPALSQFPSAPALASALAAAWAAGCDWQALDQTPSFTRGFWSRDTLFITLNSPQQDRAAASIVISSLTFSGWRKMML